MLEVSKIRVGNPAFTAETKITHDLEHILQKYPKTPVSDIKLSGIEVFFTPKHVVGAQALYEVID